MIPTEHEEQRAFVQWFRGAWGGTRILAIPNGGARSRSVGRLLKAEGVVAGVPDLFVPEWRVWVEMKRTKGGSLSESQKDWIRYLRSVGHDVLICRGAVDAVNQINAWVNKQTGAST